MTDSARIDAVAEAICEAEGHIRLNQFPDTQDTYRRMAQAALDALQLTEEWAVYTDRNTRGELVNTQLKAENQVAAVELADNLVEKFWRKHEGVAGAGMVKPNPEVRSRLISSWVRVDGGDQ